MGIVERIQYQKEFLKEEELDKNINILWGKVLPIFMHRKYLYDRFTRKNDTNDVVVALEYYISIIASGYFGGKEPQYKVKKVNETQKNILKKIFNKIFGEKNNPDEFQTIIDYITKYNDNGSFFYDCVKDYVNTGACYGFKLYKSIIKDKRKENIKLEILRHTIFSLIMLILLIISAIIEIFISTNILSNIIKYF